mmetsp:Transcript_92259/g.292652  ORF Transcript_92259/g.292652 Transcript_92259/m.292652 type:complete len:366 (+) Transcript_92259:86-1183(+)
MSPQALNSCNCGGCACAGDLAGPRGRFRWRHPLRAEGLEKLLGALLHALRRGPRWRRWKGTLHGETQSNSQVLVLLRFRSSSSTGRHCGRCTCCLPRWWRRRRRGRRGLRRSGGPRGSGPLRRPPVEDGLAWRRWAAPAPLFWWQRLRPMHAAIPRHVIRGRRQLHRYRLRRNRGPRVRGAGAEGQRQDQDTAACGDKGHHAEVPARGGAAHGLRGVCLDSSGSVGAVLHGKGTTAGLMKKPVDDARVGAVGPLVALLLPALDGRARNLVPGGRDLLELHGVHGVDCHSSATWRGLRHLAEAEGHQPVHVAALQDELAAHIVCAAPLHVLQELEERPAGCIRAPGPQHRQPDIDVGASHAQSSLS